MVRREAKGTRVEKEVLTAEDLARYLGFNKNWIYRKAESGEIPGVKLGKAWRFKKSVIDRWLEERIELEGAHIKAQVPISGSVPGPKGVRAAAGARAEAEVKAAQPKPELEELPPEAAALLEEVFETIKRHPEGVTLPKIGAELGMDWRRLTSLVNRLLREGRARREAREYFPVG